jgi:hypothetical protein
MPKLLLSVYSTDPDTNADCDVAVVEVSSVMARTGLTRIDRVRTLRAEETELCAMHYRDFNVRYYSFSDALDEMVERLTGTDVYSALDSREFVTLPDDVVLSEKHDRRTDANVMVVTDTEISWKATPAHSRVIVSTARLNRAQLTEWAALSDVST